MTSPVRDFFQNQTIFITGGTGFIGKVILEKLLRECNDLKRIYLLVRPKKGKSAEERIKTIFEFPCFDLLKSRNVNYVDKVVLINGDCYDEFLGLSVDDVEMLKAETTCVIHAAASVKFDQSLKEAACYVRATRDVLLLAKQMPRLKAFVYVSTAYANCLNSRIKEDFYEPPIKPDKFLTLVDIVDDDVLKDISPRLLGDWPNSYVFTKCISEDLVKTLGEGLPVSVVRPAIISSSVDEPIVGWIDNFYGVVGVVLVACLGVLRSLHAKKNCVAAIVPVDYVGNLIIAAAAQTTKFPTVYNFANDDKNFVTWESFMKIIEPHCWVNASEKVIWYFGFVLRENETWHNICVFLQHTVPAYIVDFILKCVGRTPLAVDNYKRLNKLLSLLSFFTTRDWIFEQGNVLALRNRMGAEDRKLFNFNLAKLDFDDWSRKAAVGGRQYLLKDTVDTIPKGNRKMRFLCIAHYSLLAVLYFILYKFVAFIVSLIF